MPHSMKTAHIRWSFVSAFEIFARSPLTLIGKFHAWRALFWVAIISFCAVTWAVMIKIMTAPGFAL